MSKNNIYIAEALLKERKRKGKTEYLVKWRGWSAKHNSWEPRENIIGERLFEEFEARNARKAARRGSGRKGKRGKHTVIRDESEDEETSVEPSPSRRRGRPRKQPKVEDETVGAEPKDEEKEAVEGGAENIGSMSLEKEEEEEEIESEKEKVEKIKTESVTEKRESTGTAEVSKEAESEEKEADSSRDTSGRSDQPSTNTTHSSSTLETSSSTLDEEPGPSTVEEVEKNTKTEKETKAKEVEDIPVKSNDTAFKRPVEKDISIPRTFLGHMTPMRIESSEHQEEVQTHAFVISEPGASSTTEELQVYSEKEQIQAIKKELMNDSGWTEHGAIRHDSFQYSGAHALTEIVGKDGKPVRFISL